MRALSPDAVDVSLKDEYLLRVTFSNGEKRLFDLTPLLERKCYARLNDQAFRAGVFIHNGCVTWPGDIDLDPEWLYEDSVSETSDVMMI